MNSEKNKQEPLYSKLAIELICNENVYSEKKQRFFEKYEGYAVYDGIPFLKLVGFRKDPVEKSYEGKSYTETLVNLSIYEGEDTGIESEVKKDGVFIFRLGESKRRSDDGKFEHLTSKSCTVEKDEEGNSIWHNGIKLGDWLLHMNGIKEDKLIKNHKDEECKRVNIQVNERAVTKMTKDIMTYAEFLNPKEDLIDSSLADTFKQQFPYYESFKKLFDPEFVAGEF